MKPYLLALILLVSTPFLQAAPVPAPPAIAASGYLLIDMHSGRELVALDSDQRMEPASLTKIMTAHVLFEELAHGNLKLDDMVRVSEKAWKEPGSRMFIEVNTQVSVENLMRGLIIQSGNDAAVALAEYVAGSEDAFANLMNEHAARMGMDGTHFVNATGLPHPDHYTTPRDIARVTIATIRDYPEYYKMYAEKEFTFNKIRQHNRNNLLWRDETVDGVKTGHTKSAGYCLVASAEREGMRLVSVVMGADSAKARLKQSQALLNYGFRFYETHPVYKAGQALAQARIWKGEQETVPVGLQQDLHITIPRRQFDKLAARSELKSGIQAPINKGDVLGEAILELQGETVTRVPLVALQDMPEGGLWRLTVDTVKQWME